MVLDRSKRLRCRIRRGLLLAFALAWLVAGPFASANPTEPSVLLVTFDGVDRTTLVPPVGGDWFVADALPGSNRPARALFGLLSGIPPALVEGKVADVAAELSIGHRMQMHSGSSHFWVATRDRKRVRLLRALAPDLTRYRRLRATVRDLEESGSGPGFYWVDIAKPMAGMAANTVRRLARALGERPLVVVATTVEPDRSGLVPLWIGNPSLLHVPGRLSGAGEPAAAASSPNSLEAVAVALQSLLGLRPSPLAAGAWPQSGILLREELDASGTTTISARRGPEEVRVTWQEGSLSACWRRSAADLGCRWTRARPERGNPATDDVEDAVRADGEIVERGYRDLENHLLWILERRLD